MTGAGRHPEGPHQGRPGEVQGQAEERGRPARPAARRRPDHRPDATSAAAAGQEGRRRRRTSRRRTTEEGRGRRRTRRRRTRRRRRTAGRRRPGGFQRRRVRAWITEFLKAEGAACIVSATSGKPHGLLVTTGGWRGATAAAAEAGMPARVHGPRALRAALPAREPTRTRSRKVEVEIENKFIPGPITVYNTVGEIRGSEKPDEFVVVGAHLDSWDLGQGTTDNGTGSCVVLETARVVAALAKQGHAAEADDPVRAVHRRGAGAARLAAVRRAAQGRDAEDTRRRWSTTPAPGKVLGFGTAGPRSRVWTILEPELASLKEVEGWTGLSLRRHRAAPTTCRSTRAGVPGFACLQDTGRVPAHAPHAERHVRQGEGAEPDPGGAGDGRDGDADREPAGPAAAEVIG